MERLRNSQSISVGISDKKGPHARMLTERVMIKGASKNKKKVCNCFISLKMVRILRFEKSAMNRPFRRNIENSGVVAIRIKSVSCNHQAVYCSPVS
jgi:hypothetical protein